MSNSKSLLKEMTEDIRRIINQSQEKISDCEVLELIEEYVLHDQRTFKDGYSQKKAIIENVYNATRMELDILQPLADNQNVSEIMVNGLDNIFIEINGKIEKTNLKFDDFDQLEEIIRRIAARVHREINELNPIVDARLEDGSRVNAIYKNIAINGPILTIRRFPQNKITMEDLIRMNSITVEAAEFLKSLVVSGYNIFISGGTSSGKTTFLNVLTEYIPEDERVIVIEDSCELQISKVENIVRLETKNANVQGKGEISVRQLIKASLRMRPDRIIVGEVRGGEVLDMIQAMNTGHDGSLSTGHGNSPQGMICRLETMFLTAVNFPLEAVRGQIASAIDIIVHLGKLKDKSRRVLEIVEVQGLENGIILLNELYKFQIENITICNNEIGRLVKTKNELLNTKKLEMKGYYIN
ncbi:MAG: CpaF family protein [Eubacteriales bacterium]